MVVGRVPGVDLFYYSPSDGHCRATRRRPTADPPPPAVGPPSCMSCTDTKSFTFYSPC